MYCSSCGTELIDQAVSCVKCGVPGVAALEAGKSDRTRVAYVLLGLFLGGLGVHNFYAGRTGVAVAQLLITVLTCWLIFPVIIMWIWVLIEICTVKKDSQGRTFC